MVWMKGGTKKLAGEGFEPPTYGFRLRVMSPSGTPDCPIAVCEISQQIPAITPPYTKTSSHLKTFAFRFHTSQKEGSKKPKKGCA